MIKRLFTNALDSLTAQIIATLLVIAWLIVTVITYSKVIDNSNKTKKLSISNRDFVTCVAAWANMSTQRNERIGTYTSARSASLVTLEEVRHQVFAVVAKVPFDRVAFKKALDNDNKAWKDYVNKNDALNRAIKDNPIPPAPKFVCGDKP